MREQITLSLRYSILRRDNFKCVLCGRSPATDTSTILEIDHIIPVSRGGTNDPKNLRTTCFECNRGKKDKLESTLLLLPEIDKQIINTQPEEIKKPIKYPDGVEIPSTYLAIKYDIWEYADYWKSLGIISNTPFKCDLTYNGLTCNHAKITRELVYENGKYTRIKNHYNCTCKIDKVIYCSKCPYFYGYYGIFDFLAENDWVYNMNMAGKRRHHRISLTECTKPFIGKEKPCASLLDIIRMNGIEYAVVIAANLVHTTIERYGYDIPIKFIVPYIHDFDPYIDNTTLFLRIIREYINYNNVV
jgi:hypothetical protein